VTKAGETSWGDGVTPYTRAARPALDKTMPGQSMAGRFELRLSGQPKRLVSRHELIARLHD